MQSGNVSWGPAVRARSALPPKEQLEYLQALGTVALLALAILLFGYYAATRGPRRALSFVLGRAGVKS